MIREYIIVNMVDNVGVRRVWCICVLGGFRKRYANVGDIIVVVVYDVLFNGLFQEGQVVYVVVVRIKKEYWWPDGLYICFDENAVVLFDENKEL